MYPERIPKEISELFPQETPGGFSESISGRLLEGTSAGIPLDISGGIFKGNLGET